MNISIVIEWVNVLYVKKKNCFNISFHKSIKLEENLSILKVFFKKKCYINSLTTGMLGITLFGEDEQPEMFDIPSLQPFSCQTVQNN